MIKFDVHLIITIVVYLILIFWMYFALKYEKRDIKCKDSLKCDPEGKTCGSGMGRAYANFKPNKNDTLEELLEKLRMTSRYETTIIVWRRSYIIALIVSVVVLLVLKNRLPHGIELAAVFFTTYIIIYMALISFQKWITDPALKQFDDILDLVQSKI